MNKSLRGVIGLVSPFLLVAACSAAPEEQGDDGGGDDGQPMTGGNAGSGGSGTSGTPATGGVSTGGATSTGGIVGNGGGPLGGAGGTDATGGAVSTGGTVSTGGALGTGGIAGTGGSNTPMGGTNSAGMSGRANGGSGGALGTGGKGGTAGTAGKGGTAGTAGKGGSGGSGAAGGSGSTCTTWPTANGSQSVSSTINVSGTYDGTFKRFSGSGALGGSGQQEGQGPLFELANGATLKNVIIGSPAADGVHCAGSCTLDNVWWEDVGEDAATFRGTSSSATMTVRCGGAKNATDKIFQHNGAGTLTIQNFTAETFSKLYRSCGNCSSQYARHVVLQDITARGGSVLVGINTNYGDTADFDRITVYGSTRICERYTGNSTGAEPVRTGEGPDSMYCRYTTSDITQR
ncbi:MAG TPA: pectate lyase [Polyangiaceae bacterium]